MAPPRLIQPNELSPETLAYITEWNALNLSQLNSGQVLGAERYTRLIDTSSAQQVVQSTTTETEIYSIKLAGGTLGAQGGVRILCLGTFLSSGGSSNLSLRFSYGATSMHSAVVFSGTVSSRIGCVFDLYLTAADSTTAQFFHGILNRGTSTNTVFGTATEDSKTNLTISVKITHSVSASTTSYHRNHVSFFKYAH